MANLKETLVLENGSITAAAYADSTAVSVRGAKAVHFLFLGTSTAIYAAADAFKVNIRTRTNEAVVSVTPANAAKYGLTTSGHLNLNSVAGNTGVIVTVLPLSAQHSIAVQEIGCRATAGGVNMTDVDIYAYVER